MKNKTEKPLIYISGQVLQPGYSIIASGSIENAVNELELRTSDKSHPGRPIHKHNPSWPIHLGLSGRSELRSKYIEMLDSIPDADYAWFTGWLCADGSIKPGKGNNCKIRFTITDKDPLEKFSDMFGSSVRGPFKPHGLGVRMVYEWGIAGWKAVQIMTRCLPRMSDRYRERAEKAIHQHKTNTHWGRKINPDIVADIREMCAQGRGWGLLAAKKYNISVATVSAIQRGRIWNHCKSK